MSDDQRYSFEHDGHELVGHLATPASLSHGGLPGLVICHGFPSLGNGAANAGQSYYELADRIAREMGWAVLAFNYRGCGDSGGDFSLAGWLSDIQKAAACVRALPDVRDVWLAGFGTGGALSICAAADDPTIRGVAAMAPPADFEDWASDPRRLLQHARELGAITTPGFPEDFDTWAKELRTIKAVDGAARLAPRPLLVVHGAEDDTVPTLDARVIADAHGEAEL
ncbi:MAG: alpha/beta fold hydrolase, partial [Acidimicrobiales bacterium]|nr:alpha/beta fold hydrolase [Acidimicrobiales bacterium]